MKISIQTLIAAAGLLGALAAQAQAPAAPAVETQSATVSKTGVAPSTGSTTKTPPGRTPHR